MAGGTKDELPSCATSGQFRKLASSPKPKRDEWKYFQLEASCPACVTKTFGRLVLFHVLTVLVAVVGFVLAVMMLVSAALSPGWFLLFTYGALVCMLGKGILTHVKGKCLQALAFIVLVGLYVLSCFNHVTLTIVTIVPVFAFTMFAAQLVLFCLGCLILWLVEKDVQLGVSVAESKASTETLLRLEECADRFALPFRPDDKVEFKLMLPIITLTRRIWALVFYYAVLKLIVGAMSALMLLLVLVQPVAALCTLGDDPFLGVWIDSQVRPVVYCLAIILLWVVGVLGLRVVAKLSMKWTVAVCGPWESDEPAHGVKREQDVPSTPGQESSAASLTQI